MQAAGLKALKEGAPMQFGLLQGDADAGHPAALVRAQTNGREHGGIARDPAMAHLSGTIFSYRASRIRYLLSPEGR